MAFFNRAIWLNRSKWQIIAQYLSLCTRCRETFYEIRLN